MSGSYQGACFCGAVEIEVTGQPNAMGYCHCRSCRWWSGGPVNAFTLWAPEAVKVTKGEQHIGTYHKTEVSYRQFCQLCGGHLMTRHPPLSLIDVCSPRPFRTWRSRRSFTSTTARPCCRYATGCRS
jgi:hypothetical protein